jgi:hypothetical protein
VPHPWRVAGVAVGGAVMKVLVKELLRYHKQAIEQTAQIEELSRRNARMEFLLLKLLIWVG